MNKTFLGRLKSRPINSIIRGLFYTAFLSFLILACHSAFQTYQLISNGSRAKAEVLDSWTRVKSTKLPSDNLTFQKSRRFGPRVGNLNSYQLDVKLKFRTNDQSTVIVKRIYEDGASAPKFLDVLYSEVDPYSAQINSVNSLWGQTREYLVCAFFVCIFGWIVLREYK